MSLDLNSTHIVAACVISDPWSFENIVFEKDSITSSWKKETLIWTGEFYCTLINSIHSD